LSLKKKRTRYRRISAIASKNKKKKGGGGPLDSRTQIKRGKQQQRRGGGGEMTYRKKEEGKPHKFAKKIRGEEIRHLSERKVTCGGRKGDTLHGLRGEKKRITSLFYFQGTVSYLLGPHKVETQTPNVERKGEEVTRT